MTDTKTLHNKEPVAMKSTETQPIQSFKPSVRQYWSIFAISLVSILLAFTSFGIYTTTGLCLLSISCLLIVYRILSVYTTRYAITHQGVLVKKGPFSRKFTELPYCDINNISLRQRTLQKRLKVGDLTINTNQVSCVMKGIKNPHKIKELMNREKASAYERRTFLRKIL